MEASKMFLFIFLTSLSPSFASAMELDPTVRKLTTAAKEDFEKQLEEQIEPGNSPPMRSLELQQIAGSSSKETLLENVAKSVNLQVEAKRREFAKAKAEEQKEIQKQMRSLEIKNMATTFLQRSRNMHPSLDSKKKIPSSESGAIVKLPSVPKAPALPPLPNSKKIMLGVQKKAAAQSTSNSNSGGYDHELHAKVMKALKKSKNTIGERKVGNRSSNSPRISLSEELASRVRSRMDPSRKNKSSPA